MKNDVEIENVVAAGERNQETVALIQNWCHFARVEKFGGVGLVEMETGLPIGHHSMGCDHAPVGGIAAWELADAAIDFHDRNCAQCTMRVPVGLPSIAQLIDRRDAERDRVEVERLRSAKVSAEQLDRRTEYRQGLRQKQPAESMCILELVDDLDRQQDAQAKDKLVGMAKIAPDAFTPDIVEYCFILIEAGEAWFYDTGIELLPLVAADIPRIVGCAMRCLETHSAIAQACAIVEHYPSMVEEGRIQSALPALVWRAEPERSDFFDSAPRIYDPRPVIELHKAKKEATEAAIVNALDSRDPYEVSVGARAIAVLAESSDLLAGNFSRSLLAKLARLHLLMDQKEERRRQSDEVINRLQIALSFSLEDSPESTDKIAGSFLASAPAEGEERIYKAYALTLNPRRREEQKRKLSPSAQGVVLRRLIKVLSSSKNYEILQLIRGSFDYLTESVLELGRNELSTLLGAAMMLDDRLVTLAEERKTLKDGLALMEHSTFRDVVYSVQGKLLEWAASSSAGDYAATAEFLDVLRRLPEGGDRLRAAMITELHRLVTAPTSLNAVLPFVHSAMVSSSTLQRSAASEVLRCLSRERRSDIPDLLFETFNMHLTDPYVIVHKSAIRTLEYIELPKELEDEARAAVWRIIMCYAHSGEDGWFLADCIKMFLSRFDSKAPGNSGVRRILVALLDRVDPTIVEKDLHWLSRRVGEVDGFSGLVIKALEKPVTSDHRQDDLIRALNSLSYEKIRSHANDLVTIATASVDRLFLSVSIIETLSRAGLWREVVETCQALYDLLPNSARFEHQKLHAGLRLTAALYEAAIADGDLQQLPRLSQIWKDTENKIVELKSKNAKRRHPLFGLPSPDHRS